MREANGWLLAGPQRPATPSPLLIDGVASWPSSFTVLGDQGLRNIGTKTGAGDLSALAAC
jgi:hypothetical protein